MTLYKYHTAVQALNPQGEVNMNKRMISLIGAGFIASAVANAAVLVQYNFTHAANDPTPLTPDVVGLNMTATSILNTVGQQDSSSNVLRISDGTPVIAPAAYVTTSGDMVDFRIDANSGFYFDLTASSTPRVNFGIGRNSGATTLYSQMQIWGATSGTADTSSTLLYTSSEVSATTSTSVNLDDTAGIAAINSTNKYTSLYVQVQRRASASGTSVYRYDDFQIQGTVVAIPEPSTFALVGIALGAVMLLRRRK